jgi:cyclopropane fatty-acyl-phospholipid synthase-like methyltransferase
LTPVLQYFYLTFIQHLRIEEHWRINGTHYQRTLEAWLRQMDTRKDAILPILARAYGEHQALKWWALTFCSLVRLFFKKMN